MNLTEIKAEIDKAGVFGASISNDAHETPKIHARLIWLRTQEKGVLQALERDLECLYRDRWLVYSGKATPEQLKTERFASLRILKTDLDIFLEADDILQKQVSAIEVAKQKIALLEEGIKMCNQRPFLLKTMLDARKFEAGLN